MKDGRIHKVIDEENSTVLFYDTVKGCIISRKPYDKGRSEPNDTGTDDGEAVEPERNRAKSSKRKTGKKPTEEKEEKQGSETSSSRNKSKDNSQKHNKTFKVLGAKFKR